MKFFVKSLYLVFGLILIGGVVLVTSRRSFAMPPASAIPILEQFLNPGLSVDLTSTAPDAANAKYYNENITVTAQLTGLAIPTGTYTYHFWYDCPVVADLQNHLAASDIKSRCNNLNSDDVTTTEQHVTRNFPNGAAGVHYPVVFVELDTKVAARQAAVWVKPKVNMRISSVDMADYNAVLDQDLYPDWHVEGIGISAVGDWDCKRNSSGTPAADWGNVAMPDPYVGSDFAALPTIHANFGTEDEKNFSVSCWYVKADPNFNGQPRGDFTAEDAMTVHIKPTVTVRAREHDPTNTVAYTNNPITVPFGHLVDLAWDAAGTRTTMPMCITTCSVNGGGCNDPNWTNKEMSRNGTATSGVGMIGSVNYSITCYGLGSSSATASVQVNVSSGNCVFAGNNTIRALTFCRQNIITPAGSGNINFQGSFVSNGFSISDNGPNVRFYYDSMFSKGQPPGFKFLNLPQASEK